MWPRACNSYPWSQRRMGKRSSLRDRWPCWVVCFYTGVCSSTGRIYFVCSLSCRQALKCCSANKVTSVLCLCLSPPPLWQVHCVQDQPRVCRTSLPLLYPFLYAVILSFLVSPLWLGWSRQWGEEWWTVVFVIGAFRILKSETNTP